MTFTMRACLRPVAIGLIGTLAACASPKSDQAIGKTSAAIVGGEASDASDDAVVMIVFAPRDKDEIEICTGTLIAPQLVLTARHCVAETDLGVACTSDGKAVRGGAISADHDPREIYIFTGTERPVFRADTLKAAVRAEEVIDDGATNLCDHDLALLLLSTPITGITPAALRLDGEVTPGEALDVVGWGMTSTVSEPEVRQRRSGVRVTQVGPNATSTPIGRSEFLFDESICLGDSGGPIFAASSGAVVGVVSRGGNGSSSGEDPSATCLGATNLGIKIAPFKALLATGFERAGAAPREEPRSTDDDGGCTASGTQHGGSKVSGAAVVVLALAAVRRRRRHSGAS